MKYGITIAALGSFPFLEITKSEFDEARASKTKILKLLDIEEKFDILLANYFDLEAEFLTRTLSMCVYSKWKWSDFNDDRMEIDRRMINLLTSARLFLDHVSHDLRELDSSPPSLLEKWKHWKSDCYDRSLGYRVMEALRNFVQHRGVPFGRHKYGMRHPSEGSTRFTLSPRIDVALLRKEGGFKKAVLSELEARGDAINFLPLVRDYVAQLGGMIEDLRAELEEAVNAWEGVLLAIIERAQTEMENVTGLAVVASPEEGIFSSIEEIFRDPIDRRRYLSEKNSNLRTLARRFVSNEIIDP